MEDSFLIKQVLAGNTSAFKFLVHRYRRPIFKFLRGFHLNESLIEELAQEAFLRAFKNLRHYSDEKCFSSWLFQITKNLALNELDKSYQKHEISADETTSKSLLLQIDLGANQQELLETEQNNLAMKTAINSLPLVFKTAVVLSCLKELSLEEVAQIENCSIGTIKSRIFRGKELLRGLILQKAEV